MIFFSWGSKVFTFVAGGGRRGVEKPLLRPRERLVPFQPACLEGSGAAGSRAQVQFESKQQTLQGVPRHHQYEGRFVFFEVQFSGGGSRGQSRGASRPLSVVQFLPHLFAQFLQFLPGLCVALPWRLRPGIAAGTRLKFAAATNVSLIK